MSKVSSSSYVGKEFETQSGLRYIIHRAGEGTRAEIGKLVSVDYRGMLTDSTEFDNSYKKGRPFRFELGAGLVIKGWDEGIALLNVGDSATLFVPPHLGYGSKSAGKIPANSTLVFNVELKDVNSPAVPADPGQMDTTSIQPGLSIIWLKRNPEGKKAVTGSAVKVDYSGFFKNGKKFDSSVDRGDPFTFTLGQGQVIKGWDLGIAELRTGEKAKLLIAPELGYGSRGYQGLIPPNAKLIFDVELLEVY
ncbi:MAG: FKBP-type peptidyl-prolyl cis-trans isomerase [Vicingaceae bacterium]